MDRCELRERKGKLLFIEIGGLANEEKKWNPGGGDSENASPLLFQDG